MRLTIALSSGLLALALAAPASAQTAAGQGKYCLEGSGTDARTNCVYQTMAACEQAKKGQAQQCVPNPRATTGTGAGTGMGTKN